MPRPHSLLAAALALLALPAVATVPTTTSVVEYTCNGSLRTFSVPYRFLESSHLRVSRVLLAAPYTETVLTLGADYTVSGAGAATGGTVVLTAPATSCATGYKLRIRRLTPRTQTTSFLTQGTFSPAAHEAAFDRGMMVSQELNDGALIAQGWFDFTVQGPPDQALVTATGGTVPRSLADRFADRISASDKGAVCDGVTNDTVAIQAALVEARNQGKKEVVLPAGTCVITNVELFQGSTLRGMGRDSTILKLKPGITPSDFLVDATGHTFDGPAMLYSSYPSIDARGPGYPYSSTPYNGGLPLEGITIRDLALDGNYTAQTLSYKGWGIYLNLVSRALLENITVRNCLSHGITLKEATKSIVRGSKALANGQTTSGYGGDGIVCLSQCADNLIIDSEATGNKSIGFEDEGRFGAYSAARRNRRNRWVNLVGQDNGDHNFLALFTDDASWENLTSVGGNTNGMNIVGTTKTRVRGLRVKDPTRHGVWVRPETYGADGTNYDLELEAIVTGAGWKGVMIEDLVRGRIKATVRGVGQSHAVSLGGPGLLPAQNVELVVDVNGDEGTRPGFGVYAYNPTLLKIRDSIIYRTADHGIFIDGAADGATGVKILNTRSNGSIGGRGLYFTVGVLTGQTTSLIGSDFSGNAVAVDFSNVQYSNVVANEGICRVTYGTAAPTSGTWAVCDLRWNTAPSAGTAPGWVCTVAGSPGTWKAMANLTP